VRAQHQLAIVCALGDADRNRLLALAASAGLGADELVLTGFVPEQDLIACYRACKAFVFPSLHEGFGLPVLEAMKCGRAVIAGNRSSLPEAVGYSEALFDPTNVQSIAAKITEVLTDAEFCAALERHGLEQAKKFSWEKTARRAWAALEARHARSMRA
jgi:glycosyltransferase involved in cell wall biosynthesis